MVCRIAVCDDSRADAEYVLKMIEDWSNARCLNLTFFGEMVRISFYQIRYVDVQKNYDTIHAGKYYELWHAQAQYYTEKTA